MFMLRNRCNSGIATTSRSSSMRPAPTSIVEFNAVNGKAQVTPNVDLRPLSFSIRDNVLIGEFIANVITMGNHARTGSGTVVRHERHAAMASSVT